MTLVARIHVGADRRRDRSTNKSPGSSQQVGRVLTSHDPADATTAHSRLNKGLGLIDLQFNVGILGLPIEVWGRL